VVALHSLELEGGPFLLQSAAGPNGAATRARAPPPPQDKACLLVLNKADSPAAAPYEQLSQVLGLRGLSSICTVRARGGVRAVPFSEGARGGLCCASNGLSGIAPARGGLGCRVDAHLCVCGLSVAQRVAAGAVCAKAR